MPNMLLNLLHLALLSISAAGSVLGDEDSQDDAEIARDNSFDYFVFSQIWPITSCDVWESQNPSNVCFLPNEIHGRWTVHGLWPSKFENSRGPFSCNQTPFKPAMIEPIRGKLNAQWTDVHKNGPKDDFWKHEWSKHGTCAMQVSSLGDELKYFSKGIQLNDEYDVGKMLAGSDIVPGKGYTGNEIIKHLTDALGKKPTIACVKNKEADLNEHNSRYLLSEVRICLDKNLKLMDCRSSPIQDCSKNEAINFYPATAHKKVLYSYPSPPFIFGVLTLVVVLAIAFGLMYLCYRQGVQRQRGYENI